MLEILNVLVKFAGLKGKFTKGAGKYISDTGRRCDKCGYRYLETDRTE